MTDLPHTWYKIRPVTLLLRSLRVVLPVWMQKCCCPIMLPMIILSPILVLSVTAGECLSLRANGIILITSCPRGRFAIKQTSENSVKDIFQDLHMVLNACNVFPMAVSVSPLGKKNYRNTFVKKSSFIPHFTNGHPQLPTSSNLVYVAAYCTPSEISDEAQESPKPVRRCAFFSSLQTMPSIFSMVFVFLVRRYPNLSLPFCVLEDTLFA